MTQILEVERKGCRKVARVTGHGSSSAEVIRWRVHLRGTELTLTEENSPPDELVENRAGWVAVLLALKAKLDFGVDLRNHDPARNWDAGFVDA